MIGIGYRDDIDVARAAALEIMRHDPRVLSDPAPDVLVYALADNSVNLGIRCHVGNNDFFVAKCEITERIKKAFDAAGVSIPYPQRDVHMFHHVADGNGGGRYRLVESGARSRTGLQSPGHRPAADPE